MHQACLLVWPHTASNNVSTMPTFSFASAGNFTTTFVVHLPTPTCGSRSLCQPWLIGHINAPCSVVYLCSSNFYGPTLLSCLVTLNRHKKCGWQSLCMVALLYQPAMNQTMPEQFWTKF